MDADETIWTQTKPYGPRRNHMDPDETSTHRVDDGDSLRIGKVAQVKGLKRLGDDMYYILIMCHHILIMCHYILIMCRHLLVTGCNNNAYNPMYYCQISATALTLYNDSLVVLQ